VADDRFRQFLARSLANIGRESPEHLMLMREAIGECVVRITVDGPAFRLDRNLSLLPDGEADVDAAITAADLDTLLVGRKSLTAAVRNGLIHIQGPLAEITAFHSALTVWLHAAVRCPSFQKLLKNYRLGSSI